MASVLNRLSLRLSNGLSGPRTLLLLLLVFSTQVLAASVNLAWDPVTSGSLRGYMVYYGPALGSPLTNPVQGADTKVDVGNNTTYTVPNLVEGTTYRFAVTAYDAASVESGFSNEVSATVAFGPVAQFTASTTSGIAPLAMNFLNTSTGNITAYAWTFGDGTTSAVQSPSHVYAAPQTNPGYTVSLTVTGPGGTNTQTRTNYVTVTAPPPVAAFGANVTYGVAPLTVNFANSSTGSITTNAWSFGDGTTSAMQSPSHVYAAAGTYSVNLTVAGSGGSDTVTKTNYVTVTAPPSTSPPVAAFGANVTSGAAPLTVNFTNSSTGSFTTCAWSFGDGTTSTTPNPSHVYAAAGTYSVSLTVTGPGGTNTQTRSNYVTVTGPPALAAFGCQRHPRGRAADGQLYQQVHGQHREVCMGLRQWHHKYPKKSLSCVLVAGPLYREPDRHWPGGQQYDDKNKLRVRGGTAWREPTGRGVCRQRHVRGRAADGQLYQQLHGQHHDLCVELRRWHHEYPKKSLSCVLVAGRLYRKPDRQWFGWNQHEDIRRLHHGDFVHTCRLPLQSVAAGGGAGHGGGS